jgi:hypothetical protein
VSPLVSLQKQKSLPCQREGRCYEHTAKQDGPNLFSGLGTYSRFSQPKFCSVSSSALVQARIRWCCTRRGTLSSNCFSAAHQDANALVTIWPQCQASARMQQPWASAGFRASSCRPRKRAEDGISMDQRLMTLFRVRNSVLVSSRLPATTLWCRWDVARNLVYFPPMGLALLKRLWLRANLVQQ